MMHPSSYPLAWLDSNWDNNFVLFLILLVVSGFLFIFSDAVLSDRCVLIFITLTCEIHDRIVLTLF